MTLQTRQKNYWDNTADWQAFKIIGILIEQNMEIRGLILILTVTVGSNSCGFQWFKDAEDAVKLKIKYKLVANFSRAPSEFSSVKSE